MTENNRRNYSDKYIYCLIKNIYLPAIQNGEYAYVGDWDFIRKALVKLWNMRSVCLDDEYYSRTVIRQLMVNEMTPCTVSTAWEWYCLAEAQEDIKVFCNYLFVTILKENDITEYFFKSDFPKHSCNSSSGDTNG